MAPTPAAVPAIPAIATACVPAACAPPAPAAAACAAVVTFAWMVWGGKSTPSNLTRAVSSNSPSAIGLTITCARPSSSVVRVTCNRPSLSVAVSSDPSRNSTNAPETGRSLRSRTSTKAGTAVPRSRRLTSPSPGISNSMRKSRSWAAAPAVEENTPCKAVKTATIQTRAVPETRWQFMSHRPRQVRMASWSSSEPPARSGAR